MWWRSLASNPIEVNGVEVVSSDPGQHVCEVCQLRAGLSTVIDIYLRPPCSVQPAVQARVILGQFTAVSL